MTSAWGDAWGVAWGDAWGTLGVVPRRRRRGVAEFYYPPRREVEREDVAALPEPAPPQAVPEVQPIIPGAALPVRKPIVARDLRDLGRVLGLDAASLERARRQAEIDEDDEEVLLLL
jgi:hypothetical protein